ncbi:hypothetical protein NMK50_03275 [Bartonella harrusi]|uniref:Lysozyme n=1 Tax=Bartonella harrusi TaxID=2961895 RepID=A0ABY5EXG2_9HYPH|nr:hypothetical protein NMK50_03275 [Bartonella harrusi]
MLKRLNQGDYASVSFELQKWNNTGGKVLKGLANRRAAEAGLWARGFYVSSNYQRVQVKEATGALKIKALATIIGSCSGLGGSLAGNGSIQWAF